MKKQIQIAIITFIIVSIICCCCSTFFTVVSVLLFDKQNSKCVATRMYKILSPNPESVETECENNKTATDCNVDYKCKWRPGIISTLKQEEDYQSDGWCIGAQGNIVFDIKKQSDCSGDKWCTKKSPDLDCILSREPDGQSMMAADSDTTCYMCSDVTWDSAVQTNNVNTLPFIISPNSPLDTSTGGSCVQTL